MISILALFIAMGGASYAAIALPKNSVGTKQLRNHAVTSKKLAAHLTVANAAKLGGIPASGYKVEWAEVAADGSIVNQSGGISVLNSSPGAYYVTFPSSVVGHGVSVTPVWTSGDFDSTGTTLTAPCGTGTGSVSCDFSNNNNTEWVETQNNTNTNFASRPFFVVVYP